MNLVTREACPICEASTYELFLTTKDFSVSGEEFNIVTCNACGFHYTNPVPAAHRIGEYYKSENYVSHSSTKRGIINRLYHLVRKHTLKKKVQLISEFSKGRKLLDIGSGTGHFLNRANLGGWTAVGLEPDEDARAFAKREFNLELLPSSELHHLEDDSFDVITLWHVLEHVYDLKPDFAKIANLLAADGRLVIAVPNMNSFDAGYYGKYWAAYDLPIHLYHFVKEDIERLAGQFGLELVTTRPMKFDAFYVSMLSEKYKGGSMLRAFWIGLKSNFQAKGQNYSSRIYILKRKTH